MANQNVLQLPQQTGSADTTSVLYAVKGGNTDTGLPLTVLFNSPHFTGTPLFNGAVALPITNGGTGATTAPQALTNLGAASLLSNTFTGQQSINTLNSTQSLTITDTGASGGANIRLVGSGGTTPSKSIRAAGGEFDIVNDAYSVVLLRLTDAGVMTTAGGITSTPISGSTGAFTTLSTPSATITGGTSNGMVIGNSTQAAGAFTTLIATGIIMPNQTAGIQGTTTNNNANAGSAGEFVNNSASGVALATGIPANVTSISLTAGDWDVWGNTAFVPNAGTIPTAIQTSINIVSATQNGGTGTNSFLAITMPAGAIQSLIPPVLRISVAATTTVFLVAQSTFTVSTFTVAGFLSARRRR